MIEDSEYTSRPSVSGEVLFSSGGTADCYKRIIGNRAYCIKRPKPQYCSSEDYMNLFRKEFTLGIELEHPNIVRYFDFGEDERGSFIKMDYVDGESLDHFAAKHLDFFGSKKNRQQLLNELLDAMAYLHGKQMLHLDLKPSNILITNKGHHVKLIDMGFAWTEGFLQEGGFSRDYSAPEQLNNQSNLIGASTDIYALGKIMQQYHLAKDSVIKRCLKQDPKERFQSIEALKNTLRPKRWQFVVIAAIVLGALGWTLSTAIQQKETASMPHDTLYIMQVDTVFIPEQKLELTLDDSLVLFKEELQNALAPTFSYWYGEIYNAIDIYSNSKEYNFTFQERLETVELYMDKALVTSRGIIKERICTMHLSETAKPHYEKAAQEIIDYYLKDYRKLKKQLEKERDAS